MSANNATLIKEIVPTEMMGKVELYDVYDINVDTYPKYEGFKLNKTPFNNLKDAIKFAQKQQAEYGISFKWVK